MTEAEATKNLVHEAAELHHNLVRRGKRKQWLACTLCRTKRLRTHCPSIWARIPCLDLGKGGRRDTEGGEQEATEQTLEEGSPAGDEVPEPDRAPPLATAPPAYPSSSLDDPEADVFPNEPSEDEGWQEPPVDPAMLATDPPQQRMQITKAKRGALIRKR